MKQCYTASRHSYRRSHKECEGKLDGYSEYPTRSGMHSQLLIFLNETVNRERCSISFLVKLLVFNFSYYSKVTLETTLLNQVSLAQLANSYRARSQSTVFLSFTARNTKHIRASYSACHASTDVPVREVIGSGVSSAIAFPACQLDAYQHTDAQNLERPLVDCFHGNRYF